MGQYQKTHVPGIFKYVGKKETVYGIDFYAGGKKHREIVGPLLGDARKKLEERKNQAERGIVVQKKKTFRDLAQKCSDLISSNHSLRTSHKYMLGYWKDTGDGQRQWNDAILSEHFGGMRLFQITPLLIEEYKKMRKDGFSRHGEVRLRQLEEKAKEEGRDVTAEETEFCKRSAVSVNRELEVLRHTLNKAVEWAWLDENPFHRFKESVFFEENNKRVRFLTRDEILRLLEVSPPYLRNIIIAAIFTGLRKGDLLNLRWPGVDLERGIITYKEQKKKGKERVKAIPDDMVALLMEIPKGKDDHVFCGPDGEPLKDAKRSFHTALKRAGITDFHFHDLRHTSASHLVMKGATLKTAQEHLEHTSPSMTQRYAHLSNEFRREEIQRLNGLCGEIGKKLVTNEQIENSSPEATIATA